MQRKARKSRFFMGEALLDLPYIGCSRFLYIQVGAFAYSIVASRAERIDRALVNANSIALVISRAHLANAKRPIVKCPLG